MYKRQKELNTSELTGYFVIQYTKQAHITYKDFGFTKTRCRVQQIINW